MKNCRTIAFFRTPEPYISAKLQNLNFLQNSGTLALCKTPEP